MTTNAAFLSYINTLEDFLLAMIPVTMTVSKRIVTTPAIIAFGSLKKKERYLRYGCGSLGPVFNIIF